MQSQPRHQMEICDQFHARTALLPGGRAPFTHWIFSVGPHSRSGRSGEEKEPHPRPCRESNTGQPARCLVTILIELTRLPTDNNTIQNLQESDLDQQI
jgi:hypothetical protein